MTNMESDNLKQWYEYRYKDDIFMPPFDELTEDQKAFFARSLDFSAWELRRLFRKAFRVPKSVFPDF